MTPADKHSLTQAVKAEAYRLGFSLIGITTPDPPAHLDVFRGWLERGRHGTMAYLARDDAQEKRADPRLILPGCRSIIVLGAPYGASKAETETPPLHGRTAAYAWGKDYHEVLPERMRALVQFLEAQTGAVVPNRFYTDTGPILERELAQRAGLGWIGKNTCLINPHQGSYFLLAEIFLGIELETDVPFAADHCGRCRRCIEACPTDCILPDRTLDAARCISYLTIENKGPIPADLRAQMGGWVFGCDICQQVCPWNQRFASPAGDPVFDGGAERRSPNLTQTLQLSPEAFNRQFKAAPVQRARRRGYLRSAAVALGNLAAQSQDAQIVETLTLSLSDGEPLIRGHAAWALSRVGGLAARAALQEASRHEADAWVLTEIQAALEGMA